ncbi:MAG: hypothetical protein ABIF10_04355 [Candidatus Woesearchaeota archaeon]
MQQETSKLESLVTGDCIRPENIFRIDSSAGKALTFYKTELGDILYSDRDGLWQLEMDPVSHTVAKDRLKRIHCKPLEDQLVSLSQQYRPRLLSQKEAYASLQDYKPNADPFAPFSRDFLNRSCRLVVSEDGFQALDRSNRDKAVPVMVMSADKQLHPFIYRHDTPDRNLKFIGGIKKSSVAPCDLGVEKDLFYQDISYKVDGKTKYFRVVAKKPARPYSRMPAEPVSTGGQIHVFDREFRRNLSKGVLEKAYAGIASAAGRVGGYFKRHYKKALVGAAAFGVAAWLFYNKPAVVEAPREPEKKEAVTPKQPQFRVEPAKYHPVRQGERAWDLVKKHYGVTSAQAIKEKIDQLVMLNKDKYPEIAKDTVYVKDGRALPGRDGIGADVIRPGWQLLIEPEKKVPASPPRTASIDSFVAQSLPVYAAQNLLTANPYNNLQHLVDRYNARQIPKRDYNQVLLDNLNKARASGIKLNRFCQQSLEQPEISFITESYKDSSRSIKSILADFEQQHNMKISKGSLYRVLDLYADGLRRNSHRKA